MKYNFSENEWQSELEDKLRLLKKDYQKPQMSEEQFEKMCKKMEEGNMANSKEHRRGTVLKAATTAAAVLALFIILPNSSQRIAYAMEKIPAIGKLVEVVTFRDYKYETERNKADIEVPEIKIDENIGNSEVQEKIERSVDEINAEIQKITGDIVEQFETYLEDEKGYQDVIVKSEVLATTKDYFTLKLLCYQGAGSGYQWNYYYTIDLNSGERLKLKDVFIDGADYFTPINEDIKVQMKKQMDADDKVFYWLNDEIEGLNFKTITDETSFYINEKDNVVICFNEGDVAPMYMGAVEFEISAEALANIRK